MNTKQIIEYSKAISSLRNWRTTAVIRPYYRLKSYGADKLIKRLVDNSQDINTVWYTMEEDKYSGLHHLHLLIDAEVTPERLAKDAGLNDRFVNYCQEIESPEAITGYVNKRLGKANNHHNIYYK